MKRAFLIIAICVVIILMAACNGKESETEVRDNQEQQEVDILQSHETSFIADPNTQYIRSGLYRDADNPLPTTVSSLEELYVFYQEDKQKIGLWHKEDLYYDTTIGFLDAVEKYDEKFFEENALVFVYKCQGSGSNRHHVRNVMVEENVLYVDIDVLRPELGTCDMGEWIIITEIPKSFAEADSIEVNNKDVNITPDYNYTEKPKVIEFVSDGIAVKPYEETLWFEGYDEDGKEYIEEYSLSPLEELVDKIPELVLGKELKLNLTQGCYCPGNYVVYNEQMEEIARPEELSIGTIAQFGPGTYYLSVEIRQNGEYNEEVKAGEHFKKIYYIKFIVPEKDYGMAEQLSELGGFEWCDIDRIAVECTANDKDGKPVIIDWDDGLDGIARTITFLVNRGKLVEQDKPILDDWEQRVVFYKDSEEVMKVYTFNYGLYLMTQGGDYAFEAPPWLFEIMVEAAANGSIITFNDAVEVARRRIVGSSHEEYIDDESLTYGYLQQGGYKTMEWVIVFKPKEGSGTGVKVEVLFYRINGIEDLVFD